MKMYKHGSDIIDQATWEDLPLSRRDDFKVVEEAKAEKLSDAADQADIDAKADSLEKQAIANAEAKLAYDKKQAEDEKAKQDKIERDASSSNAAIQSAKVDERVQELKVEQQAAAIVKKN